MKKLVCGLMFLLLAASVFAHDGEPTADSGVTADSFLWGLDRALENIKLLLTFDREERIRIGLSIAEERIAEAHALKDEGKSSHDTLAQYAVALNRVKRQLEKYGAEDAKDLVIDVDEKLVLLDEQVSEFEEQEEVETARKQLKEEVGKRKTSLGVEVEPAVEIIESLITDEDVLDADTLEVTPINDTNETENTPEIAIDIAIKAETTGNVTHVVVTGDLDKEFDLDETTFEGITAAIAAELGMTVDDVSDVLTLKDANALQIIVTIEDDDLSRTVVKQNGVEKKITLAISDETAIIKEIVKRTGLTQEAVEEVIEFIKTESTVLADPDDDE